MIRIVPAGFSRSSLSAARSGVDLVEPRAHGAEQALARLGRRHAARGAGQQPQPEPRLEPADGVAERRLGDAELRRGPGEAPLPRHGEEGEQVVAGSAAPFMNPFHGSMRILAPNRMPIALLLSRSAALGAMAAGRSRRATKGSDTACKARDNLELSRRDLMIVGAASVAATAVPSPSAMLKFP